MSQNFIKVFFNFPHISSQPIKTECLEISSKYFFKVSSRLIAANQTPVSQNFIKVFFNFSAHFFAAKQKWVSQNFIKIFLSFPHVSSQPIKTECLEISSKFFFLNLPHVSSQPIKSQCLRISSKYFLKSFLPVILTKYNRISQNLIKAFFQISRSFPFRQPKPSVSQFLVFFSSLSLFPRQMTDYKTTWLQDQSTNAANSGKDVTTRLAKKLRTISNILVQYLT